MKLLFPAGQTLKAVRYLCLAALALLLVLAGREISAQSSSGSPSTGAASIQTLATDTLSNYSIPKVTTIPGIDGVLSADEWSQAARIAIDIETQPGENVAASANAEALLMENGEILYIAFIAQDPEPDKIRAVYRDRDSMFNDDWIAVLLDTFNDERRAYEFFVNPFGIQGDAVFSDVTRREDMSWNGIWESAGQITDQGYVVELAIPLKQLRFSANDSLQTWGIHFIRSYPRNRYERISNTQNDYDIACFICQFRKIEGFADLQPSRNLEVIPTLTTTAIENRDPAAGGWDSENVDPEGSLDIRWGITQDLYLNATLNPDFSQVEADSAQLDINNTFSLFFPERRTFFLDGADYFDTFQNLVHTRNISDPDYGLKLTGKSGDHSYGIMTANDQSTSFLIPGSLGSKVASLGEEQSNVAIGRYRHDIFDNSTIGALFTDRSGDDYSNQLVSIDTVLRPTDQDTVSIQGMYSRSEYPTLIQELYSQKPSISDSNLALEYRHNDRRWDWRLRYFDVGSDFRADLGFINKVDYKNAVASLGHTWRRGSDNFFDRIRVSVDLDRTVDQSGLELEREAQLRVNMNGPMQSFVSALVGVSDTYWNGKTFDEQFNSINIGFSPTANLQLRSLFRVEDIVDFANTRLGRLKRFGPNIRYQWGRHLQLNLDHTLQKFDVDEGRLFTARLSNLRLSYQFNSRSFLRFTLQHSDNDRNQDLYLAPVQGKSEKLTTQLLYSYKVNAATRFFIGYSDDGFQNDSYDRIESTNRTIFAKFSYAWQP